MLKILYFIRTSDFKENRFPAETIKNIKMSLQIKPDFQTPFFYYGL